MNAIRNISVLILCYLLRTILQTEAATTPDIEARMTLIAEMKKKVSRLNLL